MAEVIQAVAEAVADGLQVDPEAVKLLRSLEGRLNLLQLVRQVIQVRRGSSSKTFIITKQDLEAGLPPNFETTEVAETRETVPTDLEPQVEILNDPTGKLNPIEGMKGYQELFRSRLQKLLRIAKQRPDSSRFEKVGEIREGKGRHKVAGLILSKRVKKGRVGITIDDETGSLDIALLDDNVKRSASDLLLDQLAIVDVEFSKRGEAIGKSIYHPDVPDRVLSLSKKRVYAVLLSDLHLGSKTFLKDAFLQLVSWLNGKTEHEDFVHRVKYVVIAGDLVDGVGVYPGQELDLEEPDIYRQFIKLSQLLEQIPKHVKIFVIPGNHDPTRQALPQPAIPRKYAEPLYRLENVTSLGNPVTLRLHGVNILVYHGRSIDDVVGTTPGFTVSRPALAMKLMLRARHLAPIYGGRTAIAPEPEDHLVIEDVPDIFHAGHMHVLDSERYKGTLMVNSGTWQTQTSYQANMGIEPSPGITPVVDLSTLNVVVRDFTRPLQ